MLALILYLFALYCALSAVVTYQWAWRLHVRQCYWGTAKHEDRGIEFAMKWAVIGPLALPCVIGATIYWWWFDRFRLPLDLALQAAEIKVRASRVWRQPDSSGADKYKTWARAMAILDDVREQRGRRSRSAAGEFITDTDQRLDRVLAKAVGCTVEEAKGHS